MAQVDENDDTIDRWVVHQYAYDPSRHQRRHRTVAAFDNEAEFQSLLDERAADLKARRQAGEQTDPLEHFSGVHLHRGYQRQQQTNRLIHRAIRHGADPGRILDTLPQLPPNVVRAVRTEDPDR